MLVAVSCVACASNGGGTSNKRVKTSLVAAVISRNLTSGTWWTTPRAGCGSTSRRTAIRSNGSTFTRRPIVTRSASSSAPGATAQRPRRGNASKSGCPVISGVTGGLSTLPRTAVPGGGRRPELARVRMPGQPRPKFESVTATEEPRASSDTPLGAALSLIKSTVTVTAVTSGSPNLCASRAGQR